MAVPEVQSIEDARVWVALHNMDIISQKQLLDTAIAHLDAWKETRSDINLDIIAYWANTCAPVKEAVFDRVLQHNSYETDIFVLERIMNTVPAGRTKELPAALERRIWDCVASAVPQIADIAAHVILASESFPDYASDIITASAQRTDDSLPALKLWLRWIQSPAFGIAVPLCERDLHLEKVYKVLNEGIRANKTTQIKLGLEILQVFVATTETDPRIIASWNRYITLVGIVAVDASSNQMADSAADFSAVMTAAVPPSKWAYLLAVAAFQSRVLPVRNVAMEIVLGLPSDGLHKLSAHAGDLVDDLMLLQIMLRSNFVVEGEPPRCIHATKLSNWVTRLCVSRPGTAAGLVTRLVKHVDEQPGCFAPPVIIVLNAVLHYLRSSQDSLSQSDFAEILDTAWHVTEAVKGSIMGNILVDLIVAVAATAPEYGPIPMELTPYRLRYLAEMKNTNVGDLPLMSQAYSNWPKNYFVASEIHHKYKLYESGFSERGEMLPEIVSFLLSDDFRAPADSITALEPILTPTGKLQASVLAESPLNIEIFQPRPSGAFWDAELWLHLRPSAEYARRVLLAAGHKLQRMSLLEVALRALDDGSPPPERIWWDLRDRLVRPTSLNVLALFLNRHVKSDPSEYVLLDVVRAGATHRGILGVLAAEVAPLASSEPDMEWTWRVLAAIYTARTLVSPARTLEEYAADHYGISLTDSTQKDAEKTSNTRGPWGEKDGVARARAIAAFASRCTNVTTVESISAFLADNIAPRSSKEGIIGELQRLRMLHMQLLLVMAPRWSPSFAASVIIPKLLEAVDREVLPRARVYVEWLLALVALRDPSQRETLVLRRLDAAIVAKADKQPRVVSSLCRVALLIARLDPYFVPKVVRIMLPLATSNRSGQRHAAGAALYTLAEDDLLGPLDEFSRATVNAVARVVSPSDKWAVLRIRSAAAWDVSDVRVGPVCGGVTSRVLDTSGSSIDCYLTEADFKVAGAENTGQCFVPGNYNLEPSSSDSSPEVSSGDDSEAREAVYIPPDLTVGIQTKSDGKVQRTPLIVVATLCDKLPNLGALCRLCDALGAGRLVLSDISMALQRQFRSTSMTSDRWMPMQEVSEAELDAYLSDRKRDGYTLVGLEQTDTSRKLTPSLTFPTKTLLLIGRERLGIPGNLLASLDWCVEIEQRGIVRSMNVQTATAILVHAYNHQTASGNATLPPADSVHTA